MQSLFSMMENTFHSAFTLPDRQTPEHPYEYVTRVYSDTPNAKLTGLPGYTPPTFVRLLNAGAYYGTFILVLATLGIILCALGAGVVYGITSLTNIQLTFSIPIMGAELLTLEFFTLRLTPILLIVGVYSLVVWIVMFTRSLSYRVSRPYEDQYESWLDSVKPSSPNSGYPPAYQSLFIEYEDPPECVAPRPYRENRFTEKAYLSIVGLLSAGLFVGTVMMFQQWQMMGNESHPVEKQAERMAEVESRRKRFD